MDIACLDLEGVLVPEIWIKFAEKTGIDELKLTTRDIADYDELMGHRLKILDEKNLTIQEIQEVIAGLSPFEGSLEFLDWLRGRMQVVILSDTFYEFAIPLMKQLGYPTLFCHKLELGKDGKIEDYRIRLANHKREAVRRFGELNFRTIAAGDSYNDISMLSKADRGILFRPPQNVIDEFPRFPVTQTYDELKAEFSKALESFR